MGGEPGDGVYRRWPEHIVTQGSGTQKHANARRLKCVSDAHSRHAGRERRERGRGGERREEGREGGAKKKCGIPTKQSNVRARLYKTYGAPQRVPSSPGASAGPCVPRRPRGRGGP